MSEDRSAAGGNLGTSTTTTLLEVDPDLSLRSLDRGSFYDQLEMPANRPRASGFATSSWEVSWACGCAKWALSTYNTAGGPSPGAAGPPQIAWAAMRAGRVLTVKGPLNGQGHGDLVANEVAQGQAVEHQPELLFVRDHDGANGRP